MAAPSDQKATIIDGKAVAQTIRSEIAEEVGLLAEKYGKVRTYSSNPLIYQTEILVLSLWFVIMTAVNIFGAWFGQVPGLAVVIVGTRKDSQSYVSMKRKACAEVGIKSFDIDLPEQVSEAELISKVHELNAMPDVHGWLVVDVYVLQF